MKQPLAFMMLLGLLCLACSAPRIDGSSEDSLGLSLERVRASLPEGKRQSFDDSLHTISEAIGSGIDFTDVGVGSQTMQFAVAHALNGKNAEQVIAYAADLKSGRQHIPQPPKGDQKTSDDLQRPPLVVGDSVDMSGNSFASSVSDRFGEVELRRLHAELNGPAAKARLQEYVCQKPLPSFTVTLVLWYEGPYQERQVRMQMTPPLYKSDGRIENGIGFMFEHGVRMLDKGPPIDYGYRNPLDGTPIHPTPSDQYPEPPKPDCGS